MDKARETAVMVLQAVQENGAYANVALVQALRRKELNETDRRFVTELVYGAAKAGETLDWILRRYVNRPLNKMPPIIRQILRLGLYQIFYLDKVPASAACNTSVELAKKFGGRSMAGFVNAVLRTAVREPGKAAFPVGKGHATEELALRSQHPRWLIKRWLKAFGYEETERLCLFDNEQATLCLRANTLKSSRRELMEGLAAAGVQAEPSPWAPEGVRLGSHGSLDKLVPLQQGMAQVQDESSMLVAHVVGARPGEFIIDCCSAPGGKTTHLAALMENRGRILAGDVYEHKLRRIEENAHRLGIDIIETQLLDAREAGDRFPGQADRVLVDAPCSGLGVLRRKPDARWHKQPEDIERLPALQLAILKSAARSVKPEGVLVYSTCTIEDSENRQVVESFLEDNGDFELEQTGSFLPCPSTHGDEMMVQLYPQRDGTDGFFIARMRRKA